MKKYILLVFCSVLFFIFLACNRKSELQVYAEQADKQLPIPIEKGVGLIKVEAPSDHEFVYYYQIETKPKIPVEMVKNTIIQTLKTKNSNDIKLFRKHKVNLIYIYQTKDGRKIAEIKITPQEYLN